MDSKTCTKCKNEKNMKKFMSAAGKELKMCERCRDMASEARKCPCGSGSRRDGCKACGTYLCPCGSGRVKGRCKVCGTGRCPCGSGRIKGRCKDCGTGLCLCGSGRQKAHCKDCLQNDPLLLTISNMIRSSKFRDKKHGHYDPDNFIDKCFVEGLFEDQTVRGRPRCHHCDRKMQCLKRKNNMCTIERLDNDIGHIKSNCVIACWECNNKHK
ncbi:hypothetical protein KA005_06945 [bacterium]|nr:hypothetical protein [bacterium]